MLACVDCKRDNKLFKRVGIKVPRYSINRESFLFTTSNRRAEAIENVARSYEDEEVKVEVMAIKGPNQADKALELISRVRANNICITDSYWEAVEQRYEELGKAGTSSMITMEIPRGAKSFDFQAFYERVDDLIEAD